MDMTSRSEPMTLKAIGIVRNELKQPSKLDPNKVVSEIVIDSNLAEALDSLDEFSHIIVLYWMHQLDRKSGFPVKVHPKGRPEVTPVGVFASRSPNRPNPIGKATVRLLERRGNKLRVEGLDAIDGTPVIDIKPYIPNYDSASNANVPPWVTEK